MRPLNLRVEGFGPFLEPAELELADVQLFALTGPTGSGKTTLLDAITFALYRRTPRVARGFGELVHPAAEVAKVRLTFAVGEAVYRVTRAVKAGGGSEHRLEKMEGGDYRLLPASEKVAELDREIIRLVGLDYAAFTRSILLPQGEFDRFLRGTPAERRELLAGLYGLETLRRMRERAELHRQGLEARLAELKGRLLGLSAGENLAALKEHAEAARARIQEETRELASARKRLEAARALRELADRRAEVERRRAALLSREAAMEEARSRLLRAERAGALFPELERIVKERRRVAALKEEAARLAGDLKALTRRLADLPPVDPERLLALAEEKQRAEERVKLWPWRKKLGPPKGPGPAEAFDPLVASELLAQAEAIRRLEAEAGELAREERRLAELKAEAGRLGADLEKVEAEGKAKGEALKEVQARLGALVERLKLAAYHHLLEPGEPCPLCGQTVERVPEPPAGEGEKAGLEAKVAELEAELERLRERYRELRAKKEAREEEARRLKARLSEAGRRLAEARARLPRPEAVEAALEAQRRGLFAFLGEGDPRAELAERERALAEAQRQKAERDRLEAERAEKEKAALAAENALKEAERALGALSAAFAERLAEAGFEGEEALLAAALKPAEREALAAELSAYDRERKATEAELEALDAQLAGRTVPEPEEVAALEAEVAGREQRLAQAQGELGALEERINRLEAEAKLRRQLEKEVAEATRELALWSQLADDLRANRFPDFLLEHYQKDLVARASEFLAALYHGRYRLLARGGDYLVQDTWTGGERPVRTLSGGESFLASLALALALSEQLGGGKLGALFLDEGFGTLDRETLEVVSEVLQSLPSERRLVGVVTHIEELAERFADRVVVEKSPRGSRIRWVS